MESYSKAQKVAWKVLNGCQKLPYPAPHPGHHIKREFPHPLPVWLPAASLSSSLSCRSILEFTPQLPAFWSFFHPSRGKWHGLFASDIDNLKPYPFCQLTSCGHLCGSPYVSPTREGSISELSPQAVWLIDSVDIPVFSHDHRPTQLFAIRASSRVLQGSWGSGVSQSQSHPFSSHLLQPAVLKTH